MRLRERLRAGRTEHYSKLGCPILSTAKGGGFRAAQTLQVPQVQRKALNLGAFRNASGPAGEDARATSFREQHEPPPSHQSHA